MDGTDEVNCTCRQRLDDKKICDTYYDCPYGEDEMECFGCGSNEYSCHSNIENECYSKEQKCDMFYHCSNGEDERECSLLWPHMTFTPNPLMRSAEGVLYNCLKNNWYPVCIDQDLKLAQTVCEQELGVQLR